MKTYYYTKATDDVINSANQDYELAANYQILPSTFLGKAWSKVIRVLATGFAWVYSRLILRVHIIGKNKLKSYKNHPYFVYGNHTQVLNDVFMPLTLFGSQQYYALASQSNWGIPFIGKFLLPYGGLPVGKNIKQSIKLLRAIETLVKQNKHILIYPEAHLWPYYTKIRPFPSTSMNFPVTLKTPIFVMTTTYHKPSIGKRPKIKVYIDGPFWPDQSLTKKEQQIQLQEKVAQQMKQHAKTSDYSYYQYVQK